MEIAGNFNKQGCSAKAMISLEQPEFRNAVDQHAFLLALDLPGAAAHEQVAFFLGILDIAPLSSMALIRRFLSSSF